MTKIPKTYTELLENHLDQAFGILRDRIEALEKENKRLAEIRDVDRTLIGNMRYVVAVARIINNQSPDTRMNHALSDHDRFNLPKVEYD